MERDEAPLLAQHGASAAAPDPEHGGDYEILRELGRGGMAIVYLARQRGSGALVALKVVHEKYADDPEARARLAREARTISRLRHPNIVPLLGTAQLEDGSIALVTRYVDGASLREVLRRDGALPLDRVEEILRDVASALSHAHLHGIVHRDVKPENIFLEREGGRAMLADFGSARAADSDAHLTMTGVAIGTPAYMSPEQIDAVPLDGRSDLYSLGLVGWEMLGGVRPWAGESLYSVLHRQKHEALPAVLDVRPDATPNLRYAVEGVLIKSPEQRLQSADELLEQLADAPAAVARRPALDAAIAADRAASHGDATPTVTFRRPVDVTALPAAHGGRRRRRSLIAVLAVLFVAFGALIAWRFDRSLLPIRTATAPAPDSSRARPAGEHALAAPAAGGGTGGESIAGTALADSTVASSGPAPAAASGDVAAILRPLDSTADDRVDLGDAEDTARPRPAGGRSEPSVPPRTTSSGGAVALPESVITPAPPPTPPQSGAATPAESAQGSGGAPAAPAAREAPDAPAVSARMRIVAGGTHTCALAADGTAFCWGGNGSGQLGDGSTTRRADATRVSSGVRFRALSAGIGHTCGISFDGDAYCWGDNDRGELGIGTTDSRAWPVRVARLSNVRQIGTGMAHSCALSAGGIVSCWGSNSRGQLGDGTLLDRARPASVRAPGAFTDLAVGWNHSCAIAGGRAYCWGDNGAGQLGDGSTTARVAPVPVAGGITFTDVAAGGSHSCGIDSSGALYCWGQNTSGQLGDGATADHSQPVRVVGDQRWASVTLGSVHSCALTRDGQAWCWGRNLYGQLGDGTTANRSTPVRVLGGHTFVALNANGAHTCGTTTSGESFCWGYNIAGQLGDGTRSQRSRPTYVEKPNG
ncbi:MAG TPA: protein kinase [Gemmatimonadaceae bacterium]|nr:protein kinase [Gemmatimonadaceae bacterium]